MKTADYGEPGRKRKTSGVGIYGGADWPSREVDVAGTLSGGNVQPMRIMH